jgi:lambda repressor-like predicted transcriptional regulator
MEDLDLDAALRIEGMLAERGWSLPELSRRSGISLSTLRSARKRGSRYCLSSLKCICDAFGVSMAEFVAQLEMTKKGA